MYCSIELYSEKYKLCGKLDVFDEKAGHLIERKREVKKIYDGYIFQVYAQFHCLVEMGYEVKKITIHSLVNNKNHPIALPTENPMWQQKFELLIANINSYQLGQNDFEANIEKCKNCIYSNLCDFSLC